MVSHIQLLYEEYERVYKASAVLPTIHVADFVNSGQQHSEHRTKCNIFSHAVLRLNITQSMQGVGEGVGLWFPTAAVLRSALRMKKAFVHSDKLGQAMRQSQEEAGVAQQQFVACQAFTVLLRSFYE